MEKTQTPAFQKGTEIAKGFLKNFHKKASPGTIPKILVGGLTMLLFAYASGVAAVHQNSILWQVLYWTLAALLVGVAVYLLLGLRNHYLWRKKPEVYMLKWLQKQVKEDTKPELRYVLGYAYETGALGQQDYALAAQWYEKAGSYPFAQNDLGVLCALGQGVDRDLYRARKLFQDAGKSGCFFASGNLKVLEEME